ncbi:hypothetical protein SAMN05720615_101133 [Stenotrophomonas indicatrix]|nr:hypothetical protein SAMN05720615_101133 [Stenotrophomonas indicatrix]
MQDVSARAGVASGAHDTPWGRCLRPRVFAHHTEVNRVTRKERSGQENQQ